jgi:serine/threonine-protein kinase
MPALDEKMVVDMQGRLGRFLVSQGVVGVTTFVNAGGSAAVFKAETTNGPRAYKVFNPELLSGPGGDAERRRLSVQRRLISHNCDSLVQAYQVAEAEGTVIVEMEFVPWPQLTGQLTGLPDEAIVPLFTQLVAAVRFLDSNGIVHRDIKPENIHVAPDFSRLKLLDLGVARELEAPDELDAAATDRGPQRPFLATAQYSSPEYLFRLDEPSAKLWQGLNFYQLGAVLHDLVMKEPLFQHEMGMGNRWLVARAVLTKVPSFTDGQPARLPHLKALAARCLVKSIDARLQLVGWDDFILEGARDPLSGLRARLSKGHVGSGGLAEESAASRLAFDRGEFFKRFVEMVRTELLTACGTSMPVTARPSSPGEGQEAAIGLAVDDKCTVQCLMAFEWQDALYERTANVSLSATLQVSNSSGARSRPERTLVAVATIGSNEVEVAVSVAQAIAMAAAGALDLIDSGTDIRTLDNTNLPTTV